MNWYYSAAGKQAGPITEAQLAELVSTGIINDATLVWNESMANWASYGTVRPASVASTVPPLSTDPGAPTAVCAECGRLFNLNDMLRHGDAYVCANCKPIFIQKLAEGARLNTNQLNLATFWVRFAAVVVDGLLLFAVNFVIGLVGRAVFAGSMGPGANGMLMLQGILFLIQMCMALVYETIMVGKYGATLGKMACKIKVVTADGGPITYGRSLGRYFAKLLSSLTCSIGYLMAGFDSQKRALHDHICNTRVIYK